MVHSSFVVSYKKKKRQFYNLFLILMRILACTNHKSQETLAYKTLKLFFFCLFFNFFHIAILTKIFETFHFHQSAIYCIHNSTPVNHIGYMPCAYPYLFHTRNCKRNMNMLCTSFVLTTRTLQARNTYNAYCRVKFTSNFYA